MNSIREALTEPGFQSLRSAQPVTAAILEAILVRMESLCDFVSSGSVTMETAHQELDSIQGAMTELAPWVRSVKPEPTEEQISDAVGSWVEYVQNLGFSGTKTAEVAKMAEDVLTSRARGRPADRRRLAVSAYELKAADSRLTWADVARAICDCKKKSHDEYCAESIRQVVMQLQKVLKKYQISVPPLSSRTHRSKARDLPISPEE